LKEIHLLIRKQTQNSNPPKAKQENLLFAKPDYKS